MAKMNRGVRRFGWVMTAALLACGSAERKDEPPQRPGPIDPGEAPGPMAPDGVVPGVVQPQPNPDPKPKVLPPLVVPKIEPRPRPISPDIAVTKSSCEVHGTSAVMKGTEIYDIAKGGRVIGTFSGALVPLTMSAFPETDREARARVKTADGAPAFRLEGYVDPAKIDLFTARDIPVVEPYVALAAQQRVKLVGASGDTLTVERAILGTRDQVVRVTAPCSAFSFSVGGGPAPDLSAPPGMRGWRTRAGDFRNPGAALTIDVFDRAGGTAVYNIALREGGALLFWGRDARNGFLHVSGRSDIVIDGWVRQKQLEPMHAGELMTSFIPAPPSGLEVGLSGDTTVLTAPRDVPLRLRPELEEPAIGVLEEGVEIYAFAFVDGWARILPKTLALKPPDDASFWVQQTAIMP